MLTVPSNSTYYLEKNNCTAEADYDDLEKNNCTAETDYDYLQCNIYEAGKQHGECQSLVYSSTIFLIGALAAVTSAIAGYVCYRCYKNHKERQDHSKKYSNILIDVDLELEKCVKDEKVLS